MKRFRLFTWVILVINALFLVWVIAGASSGASTNCAGPYADACRSGTAAGTAIGVGLIIIFWAFVDVILGVLWMVTRKGGQR